MRNRRVDGQPLGSLHAVLALVLGASVGVVVLGGSMALGALALVLQSVTALVNALNRRPSDPP